MATMDSISAAKARLEELKGIVEDQRARKDEYAAIVSQQSDGNSFYGSVRKYVTRCHFFVRQHAK